MLNSDIWLENIADSTYIMNVANYSIPQATSNNSNITCNGEVADQNYQAYRAFNKDYDNINMWGAPYGSKTAWLQYDFDTPIKPICVKVGFSLNSSDFTENSTNPIIGWVTQLQDENDNWHDIGSYSVCNKIKSHTMKNYATSYPSYYYGSPYMLLKIPSSIVGEKVKSIRFNMSIIQDITGSCFLTIRGFHVCGCAELDVLGRL